MTSPFEGEIKHYLFKKQIHRLVWIFQVGRPPLAVDNGGTVQEALVKGGTLDRSASTECQMLPDLLKQNKSGTTLVAPLLR